MLNLYWDLMLKYLFLNTINTPFYAIFFRQEKYIFIETIFIFDNRLKNRGDELYLEFITDGSIFQQL